jgi:hypothetical protein
VLIFPASRMPIAESRECVDLAREEDYFSLPSSATTVDSDVRKNTIIVMKIILFNFISFIPFFRPFYGLCKKLFFAEAHNDNRY